MSLLSLFREVYSLDTLDTRFTTSTKTPAKQANDESVEKAARDGHDRAPGSNPSKWRTPEYIFYSVSVAIAVTLMYKSVLEVSFTSSPHYSEYKALLSDGWLFGRKVDNSDAQYAGFRGNVPYLAILILVQPLARKVYESFAVGSRNNDVVGSANGRRDSLNATKRLSSRLAFDCVSGLIFVTALHGFSVFKILAILLINFRIATALPRNVVPTATWIFNIAILFANEFAQGYSFSSLLGPVATLHSSLTTTGKFLDSFGGLIPRWDVFFKVTVLRLISFNLDYYWSPAGDRDALLEKQLDPANLSDRDRVTIPAPSSTYESFSSYLAYVLYPPLYLAGPILTFNDYVSQSTYRAPSISARRTFLYGIRFLLTLFCMEFLLHTIYVVAISKSNPDWLSYTPFQLSMLAYFNLHIIWLKLLIPWRFFRLWSLVDGIDPPENMIRCMSDNYSTSAFWRAWHRSFNRWIIRYIYVPLGGAGGRTGKVQATFNMLAVFTFVALWHDINLRLLAWGWLVVLFILPETLATLAFPRSKWKHHPDAYRRLCGAGAVFNILMMMTANLVGFALGIDGLKGLLHGIVSSWQGGAFMVIACGVLYTGVQVMFEHREDEARMGIRMKF